jgi:HEPN domain-containing protein
MFVKDPNDWLRKLSPSEWIHAALGELKRAEVAYARGDTRAGVAGCKRAAGMALNGALIVVPNEAWGRSYVDHVAALARDESVPEAVAAARWHRRAEGSPRWGSAPRAPDRRAADRADVSARRRRQRAGPGR